MPSAMRLDAFPIRIPDPFDPPPPRRMRRPLKHGQPSPGPCPGCVAPFRPSLGGGFNARRAGGLHRAVDIMAGEGAVIVNATPGIVPHKVWITTGGRKVIVPGLGKTPRGGHTAWIYAPDRGLLTYYAHALEPFDLELGIELEGLNLIGFVGRSGNATAADGYGCPHLHFACRRCAMRKVSGEWIVGLGLAVDPGPELRRLIHEA